MARETIITQAENLVAGFEFEALLADNGYDSNEFIRLVRETEAEIVIAPRSNRSEQRQDDAHLYRERH